MVQIIDSPKSFGSSFVSALAEKLPDALGQLIESRRAASEMEKENEALEKLGVNATGIKNPKLREKLLEGHNETKKKQAESLKSNEGAKVVGKFFNSPELEEVWPYLNQGSQTAVTNQLLDDRSRGISTQQSLGKFLQENPDAINMGEIPGNETEQLPGMANSQFSRKPVDVDAGLSPKERTIRQEKRYDKNLPLYEKENSLRKGLANESETIEILDELNESKKLPQNLGRINVDYKEGNLVVPAFANAETQRYIKTVNQFLNKAKDTFGARVTNFELDRFLQQLPTLANTEEGRREILKQMKYFNSIQTTYQDELQNYIDQRGGIRNVDWDVAEREAEKRAKPKVQELKNQFKNSEKISKELYEKKISDIKSKAPEGTVAVEKNGKFGYMPKKNLHKAIKTGGYKRL